MPHTDGTSPHRADREIRAPMGAQISGSSSGSARWMGRSRENSLLFLSLGDTRRVVQRESEHAQTNRVHIRHRRKMTWYYAEAGQQRGPVNEAEFAGLI